MKRVGWRRPMGLGIIPSRWALLQEWPVQF